MEIPANELMDSGMELDDITMATLDEVIDRPPKAAVEPRNLKVNLTGKAKCYLDTDVPLVTWQEAQRDTYLDLVMITEG
ncbi:hypothetical protein V5O48_016254 [Marasmius crinis-equi]|uniref:Uncharacterized protein n=1 Tax=Marasmius crinis-equi TaxID=585013 RepID=A0ABR3ESA2_9AGAR